MEPLRLAFLGDIFGAPGRRAALRAAAMLAETHRPHYLVANSENARHGSGCTPDNYRELRKAGFSALTLGDHCFDESRLAEILDDPAHPILRPANLSAHAPGKQVIRLAPPGSRPEAPAIYLVTVLGRLFMGRPADSPFDAIDRVLGAIDEPGSLAIVEIHAEATSEKQAVGWHCLKHWNEPAGAPRPRPGAPRVVAVLGSHTHVQTADARLLGGRLAYLTDLGMTGPHDSVIGSEVEGSLRRMALQQPGKPDIASGNARAQGAIITIDPASGSALAIDRLDLPVT